MNQEISSNIGNLDKKIHPEQFDQVVEAILAGKYSWACVLMLRLVGYNPMHYIPYRTYNRLLKENSRERKTSLQALEVNNQTKVVSANNREEWLTQRNSQHQKTKSPKGKGSTQEIPVQVCEFI